MVSLSHPTLEPLDLAGPQRSDRGTSTTLLAIAIWLSIFIPGHLFNWAIELAFAAFLVIAALVAVNMNRPPRYFGSIPLIDVLVTLGVITITHAIAYFATQLDPNIGTGPRDYGELARYVVVLAAFILIAAGFRASTLHALDAALMVAVVWAYIVFALSLVAIPFLSDAIAGWLYGDTKTSVLVGTTRIRLSVPFENPNYLAFFLILGLTYLLYVSDNRFRYATAAGAVGLIGLTGSRTGWAVGAAVLVVYAFHAVRRAYARDAGPLVWVVGLFAILAIAWINVGSAIADSARVATTLRALNTGGILTDPSLQGRIAKNSQAIASFLESPLFGRGSAKYGIIDVVDNQFAIWLVRIGLVGFVLLTVLFLRVFVSQLRHARRSGALAGVLSFWGASTAMIMTGAFLQNFRLLFVFLAFMYAVWWRLEHPVQPVEDEPSRSVASAA